MTKLKEAIQLKDSKLAIEIIQGKSPAAWLEYAQYRYAVWCKKPSTYAWLTNTWKTWPLTYEYLTYQISGAVPQRGWDALRLAIANGMRDVVEEIYNQPIWSFPNFRTRNIGCGIEVPCTELDVAICCRNIEMVKLFVEKCGAYRAIKKAHFSYMSPMQLAVLPNFDLNIVKYLLDNGASPNETSNIHIERLYNPHSLVLRPSQDIDVYDNCSTSLVSNRYIRESEASGTLVKINHDVKDGTVLFYAIHYNFDDHKTIELITILLDHGADINKTTKINGKEYNALEYATHLGKQRIVEAILSHVNKKSLDKCCQKPQDSPKNHMLKYF